jgi:chromosome segregation ATPase
MMKTQEEVLQALKELKRAGLGIEQLKSELGENIGALRKEVKGIAGRQAELSAELRNNTSAQNSLQADITAQMKMVEEKSKSLEKQITELADQGGLAKLEMLEKLSELQTMVEEQKALCIEQAKELNTESKEGREKLDNLVEELKRNSQSTEAAFREERATFATEQTKLLEAVKEQHHEENQKNYAELCKKMEALDEAHASQQTEMLTQVGALINKVDQVEEGVGEGVKTHIDASKRVEKQQYEEMKKIAASLEAVTESVTALQEQITQQAGISEAALNNKGDEIVKRVETNHEETRSREQAILQELGNLREQVTALEQVIPRLEEMQKEAVEIQNKGLEAIQEQKGVAEGSLRDALAEAKSATGKIEELRRVVDEQTKIFISEQGKTKEGFAGLDNRMEESSQASRREAEGLLNKLNELQDALEGLATQQSALGQVVSERSRDRENVSESLKEVESQVEKLQKQLAEQGVAHQESAVERHREVVDELGALRRVVKELEGVTALMAEESSSALQDGMGKLQKQLQEVDNRTNSAMKDMEQELAQQEQRTKEGMLATVGGVKEELLRKTAQLEKELYKRVETQASVLREETKRTIDGIDSQLKQLEQKEAQGREDFVANIARLQQETTALENKLAEQQKQQETLFEGQKSLQEAIDAGSVTHKLVQEKMENLQGTVQELEGNVSAIEEQAATREALNKEIAAAAEKRQEELLVQINKSEEAISAVQKLIAQLQEDNSRVEGKVDAQGVDHQQLVERLNGFHKELDEVVGLQKKMLGSIDDQHGSMNDALAKNTQLTEKMVGELGDRLKEIEAHYKALREELEAQRALEDRKIEVIQDSPLDFLSTSGEPKWGTDAIEINDSFESQVPSMREQEEVFKEEMTQFLLEGKIEELLALIDRYIVGSSKTRGIYLVRRVVALMYIAHRRRSIETLSKEANNEEWLKQALQIIYCDSNDKLIQDMVSPGIRDKIMARTLFNKDRTGDVTMVQRWCKEALVGQKLNELDSKFAKFTFSEQDGNSVLKQLKKYAAIDSSNKNVWSQGLLSALTANGDYKMQPHIEKGLNRVGPTPKESISGRTSQQVDSYSQISLSKANQGVGKNLSGMVGNTTGIGEWSSGNNPIKKGTDVNRTQGPQLQQVLKKLGP